MAQSVRDAITARMAYSGNTYEPSVARAEAIPATGNTYRPGVARARDSQSKKKLTRSERVTMGETRAKLIVLINSARATGSDQDKDEIIRLKKKFNKLRGVPTQRARKKNKNAIMRSPFLSSM